MSHYIAAMKALLIPFYVHFLAFISLFITPPVIKVQIVLPRLLSIHMAWWEMQCLPKSTHLWSDSRSVSPGCCSGAAPLLSFPWYVPDFRKITTRAADGSLSGITPWQALVLCFQMSPVFQSEICGTSTAGLLFDGISSYSFLIFGLMESCAIHWSPSKWSNVFCSMT